MSIYYYDDVESFARQVKHILGSSRNEIMLRSIAKKYDWRKISQRYEEVLKDTASYQG